MRFLWVGMMAVMAAWHGTALAVDRHEARLSARPRMAAILPQESAEDSRDQTLVLGRITRHPAKQLPRLQALNDHVTRLLKGQGLRTGAVVMAPDIRRMAERLQAGEVDYLVESLYGALVLEEMGLADIALQIHINGREHYRPVLMARAGNSLRLDRLDGAHILFEDPGSSSGFFLPWLMLRQLGYRLVQAEDVRPEAPRTLSYGFAGTEIAVSVGVVRGNADMGALSDRDWTLPGKVPESLRDDLAILHIGEPAITALLLVRADLALERRDALVTILAGLADDAAGREVLEASRLARVERLDEADARQLARYRALYRKHAEELP